MDIVGAAAPVPALAGRAAVAQARVAGALRHVPRAARPRHRVHEARRRHSVNERSLLRACKATHQWVTSSLPPTTVLVELEKAILQARLLLKGNSYKFKVITAWSVELTCLKGWMFTSKKDLRASSYDHAINDAVSSCLYHAIFGDFFLNLVGNFTCHSNFEAN